MNQNLTAKNLSFSINGKDLLKNVTIEFTSGRLQAILGPNGSGKSTFLKALCGIWMATEGYVLWNSRSILEQSRQSISRIISLVPQNPQPIFNYSVQNIVSMGRYLHNKKYWNINDEPVVNEALKLVDVFHLKNRRITDISCGERQRVYIARALVTKCPVLLLDEPTASLDIRHKKEIWDLLKDIIKQDKIIIVATHDLDVAAKYADQVAIFDQGSLCANGAFSTVLTPDLFNQVFGLPHYAF